MIYDSCRRCVPRKTDINGTTDYRLQSIHSFFFRLYSNDSVFLFLRDYCDIISMVQFWQVSFAMFLSRTSLLTEEFRVGPYCLMALLFACNRLRAGIKRLQAFFFLNSFTNRLLFVISCDFLLYVDDANECVGVEAGYAMRFQNRLKNTALYSFFRLLH